MKTEDILSEWAKDSKVDRDELGEAISTVSNLHSKYLEIYFKERALLLKLQDQLRKTKKLRWEYWNGILSMEEIKTLGWEPQPLKILKSDVPMYVESDEIVSDIQLRVNLQEEKTKILDSIIKHIGNRGYNLRGAIEYEKFRAGV